MHMPFAHLDVAILKYALVEFRKEWIAQTEDDILRESITIAGACMRHYRRKHLQPESMVIAPEHGYERRDMQSIVALK